jgi:hypothetical protein
MFGKRNIHNFLETVLTVMRFQVLTAASIMFKVFRDVAQCSLVGEDRCFRRAYYLHHEERRDDESSTHL